MYDKEENVIRYKALDGRIWVWPIIGCTPIRVEDPTSNTKINVKISESMFTDDLPGEPMPEAPLLDLDEFEPIEIKTRRD